MPDFTPLTREPSLAARVTDEILTTIVAGTYAADEWLPSERVLGEQFGVSRTVIREAIRVLEAKGVVEVRSGRGARIANVSPDRVSETMSLYLSSAQSQELISPGDIMEVRSALELRLIALACERANDADLDALRANVDAMAAASDPAVAAELDEGFHRLIAVATHNALFVTLLDSINTAMRPNRLSSLRHSGRIGAAAAQHRRVLDVLARRDAAMATTRMGEHLHDSAQFYLAPEHSAASEHSLTPERTDG